MTDTERARLLALVEHELKCWPEFFEAIDRGEKTFELRRDDDRGFHVGDTLWLREWRRLRIVDGVSEGEYTGREMRRRVSYVLSGFGLEHGFVCLGLAALLTPVSQEASIDCPLCGAAVRQVASATLSLALWQHIHWACMASKADSL